MMWFVSDFTDVTRKITPEKHSIHKKILIDKIFFYAWLFTFYGICQVIIVYFMIIIIPVN